MMELFSSRRGLFPASFAAWSMLPGGVSHSQPPWGTSSSWTLQDDVEEALHWEVLSWMKPGPWPLVCVVSNCVSWIKRPSGA